MRDPQVYEVVEGGASIQVYCHFSVGSAERHVREATDAKARMLLENLPRILQQVAIRERPEFSGRLQAAQLRTSHVAMIDALEGILYLEGTGEIEGAEIHVYLTESMEYDYSEVMEA